VSRDFAQSAPALEVEDIVASLERKEKAKREKPYILNALLPKKRQTLGFQTRASLWLYALHDAASTMG
jgi:hypothetical protein